MNKGTILVVDDEPINFKLLNAILKREGYAVEYADSGCRAVDMASKSDYCMIIMDLKMPDMNGIEATRRIKKVKHDINIIASWIGIDLNMPHIEVPTGLSLLIIFGTLLASMGLSYVVTKKVKK